MVGNIGQPRSVSGAPRLDDVAAVLNLMNAVGADNKAVHKLLSELHKAIEHNSRLLADVNHAQALLGDLQRRERELAEVETRANKKLAEIQRVKDSFQSYERDLKAGTL